MSLTKAQKALALSRLRAELDAEVWRPTEAELDAWQAAQRRRPRREIVKDVLHWHLGIAKHYWPDGQHETLRKLLEDQAATRLIDRETALDIARFVTGAHQAPPTHARRDYAGGKAFETKLLRRAKLAIVQRARVIVADITGRMRGIESDVLEIAARFLKPAADAALRRRAMNIASVTERRISAAARMEGDWRRDGSSRPSSAGSWTSSRKSRSAPTGYSPSPVSPRADALSARVSPQNVERNFPH
jgi:hypothetical protein